MNTLKEANVLDFFYEKNKLTERSKESTIKILTSLIVDITLTEDFKSSYNNDSGLIEITFNEKSFYFKFIY